MPYLLHSRKALVSTGEEVDWAPQPVWIFWRRGKFPDIYKYAVVFASTLQYIIAVYSLMLCN